jgi:chitin disaccharide deacetylase
MSVERLIINADDLGISQQVNEAIFDLMAENRISSATLMANAPAVRDATSRIRHFPKCSFGIHLNLTEFEPVRGGEGARLLTAGSGHLSKGRWGRRLGPKLYLAIYQELCAQVERLASAGVSISHFDSHHHMHTRPELFPVIKALQRRYRMRRVRISKNIYTREQPVSPALWRSKLAFNWALRNIYRSSTTLAFTELLSYRTELDHRPLPHRSVELMVHPGASYADAETAVLKSDSLDTTGLRARLVSYNQLT